MAALTPTAIARTVLAQASYSHEPGTVETLLSAIAGGNTGAGYSMVLVKPRFDTYYSWQVIVAGTGSMTALTTNLEGSLDGTHWQTLDSAAAAAGELRHITFKPIKYVRANIATSTVASGAPLITVLFGE